MVLERIDDEYGLDLPQLYIVNISVPAEVEQALDTRSSMSVIGDMAAFQGYQLGAVDADRGREPGRRPRGRGRRPRHGHGDGEGHAGPMARIPQTSSFAAARGSDAAAGSRGGRLAHRRERPIGRPL